MLSRMVLTIAVLWFFLLQGAHADLDGRLVQLRLDDPQILAQGKVLYLENCASCHGDNLEGQANWKRPNEDSRLPAPPHDASGHTWHHADDLLFEISKYGIQKVIEDPSYETDMPAYEDVLSDDDLIAILSYIKSTWPARESNWHDRVNETYKQYWKPAKP